MNHFFAISVPEDVRSILAHFAEAWRRALPEDGRVIWYQPEDYHITLQFLGDISDTMQGALEAAAVPVATAQSAFSVRPHGCGAFPLLLDPHVLWIGVVLEEPLATLVSHLNRALEDIGFAADQRAYKPHITLGRCRGHKKEITMKFAQENCDHTFPISRVEELVLMRTRRPEERIIREEIRYNIVQTFPFTV